MEIKEELELLWKFHSTCSWQVLEQGVIPVHVGMESPWEKATALLGPLSLRGDAGDQKSKIMIYTEGLRELMGVNPGRKHAWMLQSSFSLQVLGMGLKK